jgi:hypothetical protein
MVDKVVDRLQREPLLVSALFGTVSSCGTWLVDSGVFSSYDRIIGVTHQFVRGELRIAGGAW